MQLDLFPVCPSLFFCICDVSRKDVNIFTGLSCSTVFRNQAPFQVDLFLQIRRTLLTILCCLSADVHQHSKGVCNPHPHSGIQRESAAISSAPQIVHL